jgi:hypothetical protein
MPAKRAATARIVALRRTRLDESSCGPAENAAAVESCTEFGQAATIAEYRSLFRCGIECDLNEP